MAGNVDTPSIWLFGGGGWRGAPGRKPTDQDTMVGHYLVTVHRKRETKKML